MKYQTYEVTCGAKVFKVAARCPEDMLDAINGLDCCVLSSPMMQMENVYTLPAGTSGLRYAIICANAERFGHKPPGKLYFAISPANAKQAVWVEAYRESDVQEAMVATGADYRQMCAAPAPEMVDFFLPLQAQDLRRFLLACNG